MKILCDVYKSTKKPEVYIYVSRAVGLEKVPEDLLREFGEPKLSLTFELSEGKKLAKEDSHKVLLNLKEQGYHLQMPPLRVGELGKKILQDKQSGPASDK